MFVPPRCTTSGTSFNSRVNDNGSTHERSDRKATKSTNLEWDGKKNRWQSVALGISCASFFLRLKRVKTIQPTQYMEPSAHISPSFQKAGLLLDATGIPSMHPGA